MSTPIGTLVIFCMIRRHFGKGRFVTSVFWLLIWRDCLSIAPQHSLALEVIF